MATKKEKQIIGRAETVSFPERGLMNLPARIDTGARTSAIWASHAKEKDGVLEVVFLGEGKPGYTGEVHRFATFGKVVVATSTGHPDERYTVRLLVVVHGRKIRATFTLANRSTQVYPVLIGRNVLRGKFVVDVKEGKALVRAEQERIKALQSRLKKEG